MTDRLKFAYVVPTKDRPDDMRALLTSLRDQSVLPDQIVVVDGSDPDIRFVLAEFPDLEITYVRVFPPSLAKQRNAGMAALKDDISVAGYIDDDLVLEPDASERMADFWCRAAPDVGGASFSIINQPVAFSNKISAFFLVDSPQPGKILRSGFNAQIPPLTETTETDWLYGGATMWRRDVLDTYAYDEWYVGHGYLEDVDYSHRVRQAWKLFVLGDARAYHYSHPVALAKQYDVGRQQIINRLYFIRKIGGFASAAVIWALFGQMLLNLASSLRNRNSAGLRRFTGNLSALVGKAMGKNETVGGYYK